MNAKLNESAVGSMPSSRQYLDFVLDQLSEAEGISHLAMMGEYIIYCRGKVIGGIYDNRFLVKPAKSAQSLMPNAPREIPYPGAKAMLLVQELENRPFLARLAAALHDELPAPRAKSKKENRLPLKTQARQNGAPSK